MPPATVIACLSYETTLPWRSDEEESAIKQACQMSPDSPGISHLEVVSSWSSSNFHECGFGNRSKSYRSYVMSFDYDTLQRYSIIRSKEAFTIIEKHTKALFGRPEIVITQKEPLILPKTNS
ncbi:hypothetical protein Cni_G13215 [Canna indica]|uniref:Uncharacterized protein n=1 Tax=Canna indica TaxID=4628 RepID=A0AAQ3K9H8_9LILI|nr:hypothetical protein Cni_G13215 [Canna indica]